MRIKSSLVKRIAEAVWDEGGRAYLVGGCVRDHLLYGEEVFSDYDIEVHGVPGERLKRILDARGDVYTAGKSFGIYMMKDGELSVDIALPRSEKSTGTGHRDFEVHADPFLGVEAAARRRDFTVNSMMMDIISGEIIDTYGGREDLSRGVIRHVSSGSFVEDPLRIFRAARFAARLGFTVAPETVELCRPGVMDVESLSAGRVEGELKNALLKAERPSLFFEVLRDMDRLSFWFPEIEAMAGVGQSPFYHPEGDVWNHTMEVLDRAALLRDRADDPYAFMLFVLMHDLGKVSTTECIDGKIHAYGHEKEGVKPAGELLERIVGKRETAGYVLNMIPLHMKPNMMAHSGSSVKSTNRLFDAAESPNDLILAAEADRPVFAGPENERFRGSGEFLRERLHVYEETMKKPYVQGRDLIAAGIEPGEHFSELLSYAHKLRLAGIDKETALKQVLGMRRKSSPEKSGKGHVSIDGKRTM